ncbi:DUF6398 domain-containing protein [Mycobacterium riyadhense]|uniref:DUF6398 domain-containing protein n=2 Tax=Mycobacterium riyadhense TaxID=486698 RepID=A0A653EGA4_9MYCO|nr:DUF6398 domain-containing protein [Mycobacterium riyadhense]MCV7148145.1 hypothetical protein [Mycobacterium riyadhense]VTO95651.1 hypothetical protein BIN_B_01133 [Mycobacterium riyadhense]
MSDSRRRRDAKRMRREARKARRQRHTSDEPPLLGDVRRALANPDPLALLTYVSMLMSLTDPRGKNPFMAPNEPEPPRREELVGMFIDVPCDETSALLTVFAEMIGDDEVLRARVRRELLLRPKIQLPWLAELSRIEVYRAVLMTHVLGDGDNVILGARIPGGHELACPVYIDHNLGTLVKDAFVVPEPIEELVAKYQEVTEDPDTRWEDLNLADAKACITAAIQRAAITVPPYESDTWPACRALVEWMIRGLPDGGMNFQRPEWDSKATANLAKRFLTSDEGVQFDDRDHRDLLDSLLWYGTDYGTGDPMRWSPVKVELLLADWLPRKIVDTAERLASAPDLLRAFVRFAHAEVGIRPDLTADALAEIDALEPEYQRIIRSPRPQGPAALLAAMGVYDEDNWLDEDPDADVGELILGELELDVGSRVVLDRLDDHALPDEPFSWQGIADDVVERVRAVLELTDRCCNDLFDVEARTACRRLLSRVAAGNAEVFRRKGRSETAAAAIVWIIGKVNDLLSLYWGPGLQVKDLMSYFGVKGSPSQRAETLLRAGGFECRTYDMHLGSPDYLTSTTRRRMIELRDRYSSETDA